MDGTEKLKIKSPCFLVGDVSNFTRPIEGLGAVVDLNTREVIQIIDQGEIPVSEALLYKNPHRNCSITRPLWPNGQRSNKWATGYLMGNDPFFLPI